MELEALLIALTAEIRDLGQAILTADRNRRREAELLGELQANDQEATAQRLGALEARAAEILAELHRAAAWRLAPWLLLPLAALAGAAAARAL